MNDFSRQVRNCIDRHQMLSPGDTVIVALSGGADSMALFHALLSLREELGIAVCAAHVHHGLRGREADADAAFVRGVCAAHGVRLWETHLSPPPHASEEWARTERYAFFDALAQAERAKIATAHTGSDNAETVLFHLARGAAARGAAGIPPVRGCYIRPLLWAQRSDVLAFLAGSGISHVTDATNLTDAYARNRIRHHVLPLLEEIHAGAARSLARFADEMTEIAGYLDTQAEALLAQAAQKEATALSASSPLFYRVQALAEAPAPVRRTALAKLIARADVPQEKQRLVPHAEALLMAGHGRLALGGHAFLFVSQGLISLETDRLDSAESQNNWVLPFAEGVFTLPGGYTLAVERCNCEEMIKSAKDTQNLLKFSADCDRIHDNAVFRTMRPGDHFRPAGRGVNKPLKKWYSEQKLPLSARAALPVLAEQGTVLWAAVAGFAEGLAIHASTKTAVTISVRRTTEEMK